MKALQELKKAKQEQISTLFSECGVFFAFSKEQYNSSVPDLNPGEKIIQFINGGFVRESEHSKFIDGMNGVDRWYRSQIELKNLQEEEILDELINQEAFYTWTIEDTLAVLSYSAEEVQRVFDKYHEKYAD